MAYTLSYTFGKLATGQTIYAQIYDTAGSTTGSEITSGISELDQGFYYANITTIPDAHRGYIEFYASGAADTPQMVFAINPEEAEQVDDIDTTTTAHTSTLSTINTATGSTNSIVTSILTYVSANGVAIAAGALGASQIASNAITADKIATDAITSDELAASAITEIANAILYTALTETYAANGATVTVAQALYEIMQFHNERSVSSTTVTVKKRDGSTTAYTLTLSDATEPTSITRAI